MARDEPTSVGFEDVAELPSPTYAISDKSAVELIAHLVRISVTPISGSVKRALNKAFSGVENGTCYITLYIDENAECMTIVSSSLELQRAAIDIRSGETHADNSPGAKPIQAVFESVNSERWLEMSRPL